MFRFSCIICCSILVRSSSSVSARNIFSPPRMYSTDQRGSLYKDDFRLFFKNENGTFVSPMHDIPIRPIANNPNIFSMIVEIPRWTNAKMEIKLKDKMNPIRQDVKNGNLRYVANKFPHKGYIWNYGAIPQTWEDPSHIDKDTNAKGDGDPIDIIDVGSKVHPMGSVIKVKVLGILALVDEGETDWKVVSIDIDDHLANEITDLATLEKKKPGLLNSTVDWFRNYKIPDGKPQNNFGFNGEVKDAEFAVKIIDETYDHWHKMMTRSEEPQGISRACTQFESESKIGADEAAAAVNQLPEKGVDGEAPDNVEFWHF